MKRRLAVRDRLVWVIAVVAVGIVVYLVLPTWVIAVAVVLAVGVPVALRRSRRDRARH
jgi:Flp pilus assembly protein TadB